MQWAGKFSIYRYSKHNECNGLDSLAYIHTVSITNAISQNFVNDVEHGKTIKLTLFFLMVDSEFPEIGSLQDGPILTFKTLVCLLPCVCT